MKFTIDTTKKEIYVPNKIKLLELLELATVLDSDTEEYEVSFYNETKEYCNCDTTLPESFTTQDIEDTFEYLSKFFNIDTDKLK